MTHPGLRAERSPHGFRRLLLAAPQRHNPLTPGLARALRDAFAADPAEPVVLVSRVEPDPLPAAEQLAAGLAAGSAGTLARIKMIMTANGLLDRLHAEQEANRVAWAQALAADPAAPPP